MILFIRKFGLRGEKCIGFDQFDQEICSDYAEFTVSGIYCSNYSLQFTVINDFRDVRFNREENQVKFRKTISYRLLRTLPSVADPRCIFRGKRSMT